MKQIDTEALIFFLDNSTTISNIRHYLTDNDRKKTQSKLKQNARLRDGRLYGNLKCMTRSPQQENFVFYQIISQKNVSNKEFLSGDSAHSQCTSSVTSGKYDESVLGN